jgi:hypothetical protein
MAYLDVTGDSLRMSFSFQADFAVSLSATGICRGAFVSCEKLLASFGTLPMARRLRFYEFEVTQLIATWSHGRRQT